MSEGVRHLTLEEIVDLYSEFQHLARLDPGVRLDHKGDYGLPVEELEELCQRAEGLGLEEAAASYMRNLVLLRLFPDGNFRIALLAVEFFLEENGKRLDYTLEEARALHEKLMALHQQHYGEDNAPSEEILETVGGPVQELCERFVAKHVKAASSAKPPPGPASPPPKAPAAVPRGRR